MASHSSKRIAAGESWTMFVTAEDQVWLCGADVAFGDGNDRYCIPNRARAVSLWQPHQQQVGSQVGALQVECLLQVSAAMRGRWAAACRACNHQWRGMDLWLR